ncbi:MAG: hypothetical protein DRJ62_02450 [Thermoprotei archaeon]|nr:MAG: hypothetical protein DRJ62_02450 [Thermoprotei archaeon]
MLNYHDVTVIFRELGVSDIKLLVVARIDLEKSVPLNFLVEKLEEVTHRHDVVWAISKLGVATSLRHVVHALYQTLRAYRVGKNISNKFNIEFLLRLTCQDQINKALKVAGLEFEVSSFCLYLASPSKKAMESFFTSLKHAIDCNFSVLSDHPSCFSDVLLESLGVPHEELLCNDYKGSHLKPVEKSLLTRMCMINVRRR